MKFSSFLVASALLVVGSVHGQGGDDGCAVTELDVPMEIGLSELNQVMFVGFEPTIISRTMSDTPMIKILRHAAGKPPRMLTEGDTIMIGSPTCITDDRVDGGGGDGTTMTPTGAPTGAPAAAGGSAALKSYSSSVASFLSLSAGSYFAGFSPAASLGMGLAGAAANLFPVANVSTNKKHRMLFNLC